MITLLLHKKSSRLNVDIIECVDNHGRTIAAIQATEDGLQITSLNGCFEGVTWIERLTMGRDLSAMPRLQVRLTTDGDNSGTEVPSVT